MDAASPATVRTARAGDESSGAATTPATTLAAARAFAASAVDGDGPSRTPGAP